MPDTRRGWEKRVRGAERSLRDAKTTRKWIILLFVIAFLLFSAGVYLTATFGGGWPLLIFGGLIFTGVSTAFSLEFTVFRDVTDARDTLEDVKADYEDWKYEQANRIVQEG
jgi:uncharacterized membrane protein